MRQQWVSRRALRRTGGRGGRATAGARAVPDASGRRQGISVADGQWLQPLTVAAKAHGITPGRLERLARKGMVEGAVQVATRWYVPAPRTPAPAPEAPSGMGVPVGGVRAELASPAVAV